MDKVINFMKMHCLISRSTTSPQAAAMLCLRGVRRRATLGLALALAGLSAASGQTTQTYLPVIIADFNHDGIPDVLVRSANSPTGTVALGSVPYGTFASNTKGVTFPAACTSLPQGSVQVGDVNGDGLPDLVFFCGGSSGTAGVMLGNGDGSFGTAKLVAGVFATTGVLGDFNKDGKLDILAIGNTGSSIGPIGMQFFPGNGDGTFASVISNAFGNGTSYTSPLVADLNGDGYPDLILGNFSSQSAPTIDVYGNNKNGTFGLVSSGTTSRNTFATVGSFGTSTVAAILTGSFFGLGTTDFAVPDTGSNPGFFLVKNTSTGTAYSLAAPVKTTYAGLSGGMAGMVAGSGFTDLVAANGSTLALLANDGTGNFTSNYSALSLASPTTLFGLADANGDGYADVYTAVVQGTTGAIQLAVNLVSGTATATSQPFPLSAGTKAVSAAWPGNLNFAGSTASGNQTVNGVPSAAMVTSTKNPSLVGDSITLTTVVRPSTETYNIPSGMVVLMDGTIQLTSGTLDQTGTFAYTTSALKQSTHVIQAIYAGDSYFAASTSQPLSQVVNHAAQVTPTLAWATPAPITFGTPLSATQLNAAATDANGASIPGTYAYMPAAGTILQAGTQILNVTFTPNDLQSYTTATKSVSLTVLPGSTSTTLAIIAGGSPVTTVSAGTAVSLTATVAVGTAPVAPGLVKFCDASAAYCSDVHLLGTAQLTSGGTATVRFVPAIGVHSYKAVFAGTKNAAASTSANAALAVTGRYTTSTTIAQSGGVGNYSLTATTVGIGSSAVSPTGTVSFLDQSNNNAPLATAPLGAAQYVMNLAGTSSISTGREPDFIAVGDFNGDGKLDMAVSDGGTPGTPATGRSVSILLGNGDGTFTAAPSPATGNAPYFIAVGDYNEDGKTDLAVTNTQDNTVTVLLGNGDGTFTAAANLTTGTTPYGVGTGDFNGDGHADLVVANRASNTLSVFLGNGDGTFIAAASVPAPGTPTSIAVGDLNGDGKADLAVANGSSSGLTILLGNGDGTFTSAGNNETASIFGGNFATVLIGDFNNDGKADLVVAAETGENNLSGAVLLGIGNGTFHAGTGLGADTTYSFSIAVRDFDGDGNSDIVLSDDSATTLLLSNGDGTFNPVAYVPTSNGSSPDYESAAVGDFNGDGVPDIATANSDSDAVSLILTQLTQIATATANGANPTGTGAHQVVASYPGDTSFGASVSQPTGLNGSQLVPTLTWVPAVSSIPYGTPLGAQQLNAVVTGAAGVLVSGTYTYLPPAGTVLGLGSQTLNVTFVSADPHYVNVNGVTTITVTPATPTLTWPTPASIVYGTPLGVSQLDATVAGVGGAAVSGVFTYSPAAGTVLGVGVQKLSVSFAPSDPKYTNVLGSTLLTVTATTPTLTWPTPASIVYGTALSATQLNATVTGLTGAAVAGTFTYSPAAGTVLGVGVQKLSVSFASTDPSYANITGATTISVTAATPTLTWASPASIVYGTPLSATQLNAAVTGLTGAVSGTFTYLPAAGTVLTAGTQKLTVSFTSSDSRYVNLSGSATITVTQATPTLTWPAPAGIAYGIPLSATQLDATVAGVTGAVLPGTFTYTPAAGTVLTPGSQTLTVRFAPTDAVDYVGVGGSVQLPVGGVVLTSFTPNTATLGDPDKTLTLTGSGFVTSSVVQVNGSAVATTYVSPTTLTAVIPAANFVKVGTLAITVLDPTVSQTSSALSLTVAAPPAAVTLTGPATTPPGSQPTVTLTINNPYPTALTAVFTLSFNSAISSATDDPNILFTNGTRTLTFTVPANSTVVPPIQLQSGTVAGTITIPVVLTAGGANVTPTTLQPLVINIPVAVPTVSTATLTRNGNQLTVAIHGFSNTREVTQATFHFVGVNGDTVNTPDITAPVGTLFSGYYASAPGLANGSTFTYTQVFNVSDSANNIAAVQVTLTNTVGASSSQTAQ